MKGEVEHYYSLQITNKSVFWIVIVEEINLELTEDVEVFAFPCLPVHLGHRVVYPQGAVSARLQKVPDMLICGGVIIN